MQATDRVLSTIPKPEAFLGENCADTFKPKGQWQESVGRLESNLLMIRGMKSTPFFESVMVQLRFEGKEKTNPDGVQAMMLVIAQKVDAEEMATALDLECVKQCR